MGHVVNTFLSFWGTTELFTTVAVPFYIPTNRAQGVQFLHIYANTCDFLFFDSSHPDVWDGISLYFHLYNDTVMLSIFSCACWSICIYTWIDMKYLFKSFVHLNKFFFYCWVLWVLCIFLTLISHHIYDVYFFLPFCELPFHSEDSVFWWTNFKTFTTSNLFASWLLLPAPLMSYQKIVVKSNVLTLLSKEEAPNVSGYQNMEKEFG